VTVSRLETITSPAAIAPGGVGRFRDVQTTRRLEWGGVPDDQVLLAALHRVTVTPAGSTTITYVNPLDLGTVISTADGNVEPRWLAIPGHNGKLFAAGRYK